MTNFLIQLPGYLAFVFLAISLLVNNDIKFRWINSMGGLCFVIYGILINAYPIIITNAVLFSINIYFLVKLYRRQEQFDLVEFNKDAVLVPKFLDFYREDIQAYFPDFILEESPGDIRFVVLRDIVVANIFVAAVAGNGHAYVKINYTVPKYRDFKVGRFLFDEGKSFLAEKGIKKIIYNTTIHPGHEKFIRVMGFRKETVDNKSCYIKNI